MEWDVGKDLAAGQRKAVCGRRECLVAEIMEHEDPWYPDHLSSPVVEEDVVMECWLSHLEHVSLLFPGSRDLAVFPFLAASVTWIELPMGSSRGQEGTQPFPPGIELFMLS